MNRSSFNPQARWDRHIPKTDSKPEDELLNEAIEVLALFKNGQTYPQEFTWNKRQYRINRITYHWQERQGIAIVHFFTVACGEDLYQISFNNTSLGWRLDKVL